MGGRSWLLTLVGLLNYVPCSVVGCEKVASSLGMCPMHYSRVRRHGDPHFARRMDAKAWPHRRDCPVCPDGGVTVPFDADEQGQVVRRLCIEHPRWEGLFDVR